jgi:hypothetical protein
MVNEKIGSFKSFFNAQQPKLKGLTASLHAMGDISLGQTKKQATTMDTPRTTPEHSGFGQRAMSGNRTHQNLIAAQHKKTKHGINDVEWLKQQGINSDQEATLSLSQVNLIRQRFGLRGDGQLNSNLPIQLVGNRLRRVR